MIWFSLLEEDDEEDEDEDEDEEEEEPEAEEDPEAEFIPFLPTTERLITFSAMRPVESTALILIR